MVNGLPVTPDPSNLQLRRPAALVWLQLDSRELGVCLLKPLAKPEPPWVDTVPDLERGRRDGGGCAFESRARRSPDRRRGAMPLLPNPRRLPNPTGVALRGNTDSVTAPTDDFRAGLDSGAAAAFPRTGKRGSRLVGRSKRRDQGPGLGGPRSRSRLSAGAGPDPGNHHGLVLGVATLFPCRRQGSRGDIPILRFIGGSRSELSRLTGAPAG